MTAHAMKSFDTALSAQETSFDAETPMICFSSVRVPGHRHGNLNRSVDTPLAGLDHGQAALCSAPFAASVTGNDGLSVAKRAALCNSLLDAIEESYDDGTVCLYYRDQNAPDLACVPGDSGDNARAGAITPQRVEAKAVSYRRSRPAVAVARSVRPTHPTGQVDRIRQFRQVADSIAAPRQRAQARPVALGLPQTEVRDLSILRDVFAPEHDTHDAPTGAQALPHRLAIYALNASLAFTILPYGTAFLS